MSKKSSEIPVRPAGVPEDAIWQEDEKAWGHGELGRRRRQSFPIGEWRYWRQDGTLAGVAHYNAEGMLDGLNERYHPDGTLASRGEWQNGTRRGNFLFVQSANPTSEHYPSDARTWRYEFVCEVNWAETQQRWFLKDGRECTSDGRALEDAYDLDEVLRTSAPEAFLGQHAERVARAFDSSKSAERRLAEDAFGLKDLWGIAPPELDRFAAYAVEGDDFSKTAGQRTFEGNIWKSLIAHPWGNQYEELAAVFMGAVQIGHFGDSDGVYATLFQRLRETPTPNATYLWSHDTYSIDEVLTSSLDDFAYQLAVASAYSQERLSKGAAREAWKKLAGRANISWNAAAGLDCLTREDADDDFEDFVPKSEFEVDLDPKHSVRAFYWRAEWIIRALEPDGQRDWETVRSCFRPNFNPPYDSDTHARRLENGKRLAPLAVYLLWRYFWFDQPERLAQCMSAYSSHPAKIVRDLVDLLNSVQSGDSTIGGISDLLAVREEFKALDLVPERANERQAEQAALQLQEMKDLKDLEAVARTAASEGLDDILSLAWQYCSDPASAAVIEKVARQIPGFEPEWNALDWARGRGFERANQTLEDEAHGVGVWLGTKESRVVQPFLWSAVYAGEFATAALLLGIAETEGALDTRLADQCLAALNIREKYNHKREFAVLLIRAMKLDRAIPQLCTLIDEFFEAVAKESGYEARLATIPWSRLLVATAQALQSMHPPDSAESDLPDSVRTTLKKLLTRAVEDQENELAAAALDALTAWREVEVLKQATVLLRSNDTRAECSALRAVEALAERMPPEARRLFVALDFTNPDEDNNEVTLLYHRAALALLAADPELGETDNIGDAYAAAAELSNYGDGWNDWRLTVCDTVAKFAELDVSIVEPYLHSHSRALRHAAEEAYRKRGMEVPARVTVGWPAVWEATERGTTEHAAAAVASLIANPMAVDRAAAAAWLWEHPDEAAAPTLAQCVERALDQFVAPGHGEDLPSEAEWIIRALAKHAQYSAALPVVLRCLSFPDQHVVAAVVNEVDSLPPDLASTLLPIAKEDSGWKRYSIASWALKNQALPAVSAALKANKISTKTLQSWAT